MKDKILQILEKHSTPFLEGKAVHFSNWDKVAEEIFILRDGLVSVNIEVINCKKQLEQDFLSTFNRIKKAMCEKRNKKFSPARTVSKPSQLHARLKDYSMDEIGKAIYNAFNDNFHIESGWKYVTTEYVTRQQTIEKYLN